MRHLDSLLRLTPPDVEQILQVSADLKDRLHRGERPALLAGHVLAQLFEKPSLRTRFSFDAAMMQLGGSSIFLSAEEAGLNGRETLPDVARVLSSYADCLVLRVFKHKLIEEAAKHSYCPVINGLSDMSHPCQALGDLLTIREAFGTCAGKTIVFVGDANNVARSLVVGAAMAGAKFIMCAPDGYQLSEKLLKSIQKRAPKAVIEQQTKPKAAVKRADVIYTDVWASMGQESEAEKRQRVFAPYQVNAALMAQAPSHAKFMHCLPARRGLEVTDEVLDGPQSIAFEQAENRLHVAKGVLLWVMEKSCRSGEPSRTGV